MTKTLLKTGCILGLALALSACGAVRNVVNGNPNDAVDLPFRAQLSTGETRRDVIVTVRAGGATLDDARESARYPATRHCVDRYGRSDVNWVLDPATGDWAVTRSENGDLTVSGQCDAR